MRRRMYEWHHEIEVNTPLLGGRSPLSDPVNGDLKLPTSKKNS
jgi:hypothetical protein